MICRPTTCADLDMKQANRLQDRFGCRGLDPGPEREHAVHDTYSPRADLPRATPVGLAAAGDDGGVLHQPGLEERAGDCARRATDQPRLRDRGFGIVAAAGVQRRMERLASDRSRWPVRVLHPDRRWLDHRDRWPRRRRQRRYSSGNQTNCHHCDDPRAAPDSPALPAGDRRLRVLCVLDAAGRQERIGAPDAAIVRPPATCRHRVADPSHLLAMGAVLVRTRVGDRGTGCERRARDRHRRPAPVRTAPDAGAGNDHRDVTRRGGDDSARRTTSARIGGPSRRSCRALVLRRSPRCTA